MSNPVDCCSALVTIITFLIPNDYLSFSSKLIGILLFFLGNCICRIYKLQQYSNSLQIKMQELEKRNKAIATQFDKKNVHIDKLKHLIDDISVILLSFLGNPSNNEKDCIQQILTYINNISKE